MNDQEKIYIEFLENSGVRCEIVKAVIAEFAKREKLGREKYGKTLSENNDDILKRLKHLSEELMDATLYIYWTMQEMQKLQAENAKLKQQIEAFKEDNTI